tara:strand:+ start:728 stop:1348 length:621 start_codon:yes stop_codon:yes gene_type:complete
MSTNLISAGVIKESFTNKVKEESKTPDRTKIENEESVNIPEEIYLPNGLHGYFNLEKAKECSQILNRPILLSFMSNKSQNCKKMNLKVFTNPGIIEIIKEYFVVLVLCVNDKMRLPEEEWYKSEFDGKAIRTIGEQNADYQIIKFFNSIQPYYVIVNQKISLLTIPKGYDLNANNFISFLENGYKNFIKKEANKEIIQEYQLQEAN